MDSLAFIQCSLVDGSASAASGSVPRSTPSERQLNLLVDRILVHVETMQMMLLNLADDAREVAFGYA